MGSQRDIAIAERDLYAAASPAERSAARNDIGRFIGGAGLGKYWHARHRARLLAAGDAAAPLWAAIDKGIVSIAEAGRIMIESRQQDLPAIDALETWLAAKARPKRSSRPAKADALGAVRAAIRAWVRAAVPAGDAEAETIAAEIMADVEGILKSGRGRLRSRASSPIGQLAPGPSRADARAACALLGLPNPRKATLIDADAARRARRSMLRASHPDVLGDSSGVGAYQAVNDAFAVIEAWNDAVARGRGLMTSKEDDRGAIAEAGDEHAKHAAPQG